ncbi:hypothetical protein, partial [Ruthenibacterium lactatiformans]|uniref:hypothetical protein n=1 Tax=Ruthenibacterium lactatiformans TaxID=1550024 RepID=UPI0026669564
KENTSLSKIGARDYAARRFRGTISLWAVLCHGFAVLPVLLRPRSLRQQGARLFVFIMKRLSAAAVEHLAAFCGAAPQTGICKALSLLPP